MSFFLHHKHATLQKRANNLHMRTLL